MQENTKFKSNDFVEKDGKIFKVLKYLKAVCIDISDNSTIVSPSWILVIDEDKNFYTFKESDLKKYNPIEYSPGDVLHTPERKYIISEITEKAAIIVGENHYGIFQVPLDLLACMKEED